MGAGLVLIQGPHPQGADMARNMIAGRNSRVDDRIRTDEADGRVLVRSGFVGVRLRHGISLSLSLLLLLLLLVIRRDCPIRSCIALAISVLAAPPASPAAAARAAAFTSGSSISTFAVSAAPSAPSAVPVAATRCGIRVGYGGHVF
jgi:hypothetical protein